MRYKREILVPYLEKVYQIEMAYAAMERAKNDSEQWVARADNYLNNYSSQIIRSPEYHLNIVWIVLTTGAGAIMSLIAAWFVKWFAVIFSGIVSLFSNDSQADGSTVFWVTFVIGCIVSFIIGFVFARQEAQEEYNSAYYKYKNELEKKSKEDSTYEYYKGNYAYYKSRKAFFTEAYNQVKLSRQREYAANVIPDHYRNLSAAVYLYRYFSTSQADDLHQVIQTFVMEEVKQQLIIIQRQMDQILENQNRARSELMAIRQSAERTEKNSMTQLTYMARQEQNLQMQNQYLSMIEANSNVSAFFSTASYLEMVNRY